MANKMRSKNPPEKKTPSVPVISKRPPDGGWGWFVVFGSFMIHVVTDGVTYSFGVLYTEFLEVFKGSKGATAWIASLLVGVTLCSGPIASIFVNKYGCRLVTIAGAILASICLMTSVFANSLVTLYLTIGIGTEIMYIVVDFEDDDSVEAVPNTWYSNGSCVWPKKGQNINKLIEQNIKPEEFRHNILKAKKMGDKTYSLSEAKLKANKATITSELSSVDEDIYCKKQSKKNNSSFKNKNNYKSPPNYKKTIIKDVDKLYGVKNSGESENDMLVDKPSKKKNMQQTNPNKKFMMPSTSHEFNSDESENDMLVDKSSKKKNMQQTNPNKKFMMPSTSHEFNSDESENDILVVKSSKKKNMLQTNTNKKSMMPSTSHEFSVEKNVSPRKWCVSKISSTDNMEENYSSPIQKAWIITPIKELAEPLETVSCKKMLNFHSEPKEYINIESQSLKIANQNDFSTISHSTIDLESTDKMNKMYRIVLSLKYDIKELLSKVDRLENQSKYDEFELDNQFSDDAVSWNFPITTVNEVSLFEKKLQDKTFRFKIVKNLSMLVRSSLSETVRHILSRMFVNSVLSQYSFVGQKKKLAFSSLNACSVIFDAIRNIKQFKDVPALHIEKPLKDYLAGAKFRDLKRKNKEDNNTI